MVLGRVGSGLRVKGTRFPLGSVTILVDGVVGVAVVVNGLVDVDVSVGGPLDTAATAVVVGGLIGDVAAVVIDERGSVVLDDVDDSKDDDGVFFG